MTGLLERHPYYQLDWLQMGKDVARLRRHYARLHARRLLQPGDKMLVARCGYRATYIFAGWSTRWIVSASGFNDIPPVCILRHNGRDVAWWQLPDEQFIETAMNRTNANALSDGKDWSG